MTGTRDNMFSYKMVDTDIQQIYEQVEYARKSAYTALRGASEYDDRVAEANLKDLDKTFGKIIVMLADLKRKVDKIKESGQDT